uniref:Putative secreted peptide n=1 Tax=Anopheles braziliensis TaxID=58242 RepID=A0A2M3ZS18_9DIPT
MVMFIVIFVALQNADRVVASRSGTRVHAVVTPVRRHNVSRRPFFTFWRCRAHTHSLLVSLISFRDSFSILRSTVHGFLERCITFVTWALHRLATRTLISTRTTG